MILSRSVLANFTLVTRFVSLSGRLSFTLDLNFVSEAVELLFETLFFAALSTDFVLALETAWIGAQCADGYVLSLATDLQFRVSLQFFLLALRHLLLLVVTSCRGRTLFLLLLLVDLSHLFDIVF